MDFKDKIKSWITPKNIEGALALAFFLGLSTFGSNQLISETSNLLNHSSSKTSQLYSSDYSKQGIGGLVPPLGANYCLMNYSDNIYDLTTHAGMAPLMDTPVYFELSGTPAPLYSGDITANTAPLMDPTVHLGLAN